MSGRLLLAVLVTALAAGAVLSAGCGKRQVGTAKGQKEPTMTIRIRSAESTNGGRPLHMLVRAVELKMFIEESYAAVANQVVAPDKSVLSQAVIFPGREVTLSLPMPAELGDKQTMALYFLFTAPEEPWKLRFDGQPPKNVTVVLGKHRITSPD